MAAMQAVAMAGGHRTGEGKDRSAVQAGSVRRSTGSVRVASAEGGSEFGGVGYHARPLVAGRSVGSVRAVEPRAGKFQGTDRVVRRFNERSGGPGRRAFRRHGSRTGLVVEPNMEARHSDAAPAVRGDNDWVDARSDVAWASIARRVLTVSAGCCLVALVAWSAVLAKTADRVMPLASVRLEPMVTEVAANAAPLESGSLESASLAVRRDSSRSMPPPAAMALGDVKTNNPWANDPDVRWFNGRPAKPDRTLKMRVTAYSPDHRSCGDSADGLTATMHSVETNGFKLVAADPKVLPYGSMVSIEGYDRGQIVPVLDCGGAIKGHHIDLLFPTHEQARQWGNKWMDVTVWKYLDGKPHGDPRKER